MKFRNGFVSNSSSSSFLITGYKFGEDKSILKKIMEAYKEKFPHEYKKAEDIARDEYDISAEENYDDVYDYIVAIIRERSFSDIPMIAKINDWENITYLGDFISRGWQNEDIHIEEKDLSERTRFIKMRIDSFLDNLGLTRKGLGLPESIDYFYGSYYDG